MSEDKLTPQEREFVERLRNEYLGAFTGITLMTIVDRLAPKPKRMLSTGFGPGQRIGPPDDKETK